MFNGMEQDETAPFLDISLGTTKHRMRAYLFAHLVLDVVGHVGVVRYGLESGISIDRLVRWYG